MSTDEQIETKADIPGAVLDVSGREISILFSVDTLDRVGDVTSTKAFNRSIGLGVDRIHHLLMHEGAAIGKLLSIKPIGRNDLPDDVKAEYPDATGGVMAVSRLNEHGTGLDVLSGIKNGINYGASFGYITKKASPHPTIKRPDGQPARWLQEVHLIEVTTALPGTAINLATRSAQIKARLLECLEEMKAGRRHSTIDQESLNEIAAILVNLGATNIQLVNTMLPLLPDLDQQAVIRPALTSDAKALIDRVGLILKGAT